MEYISPSRQAFVLNKFNHIACLGNNKKKLNIKEAVGLLRGLEIKHLEKELCITQ